MKRMGKIIVRIKHVTWRGGRPRFIPGISLRAAGHKGRDLKHDDGRWFSLDEAAAWSAAFEAGRAAPAQMPAAPSAPEIGEQPAAAPPRRKRPAGALMTVGQLVALWQESPRFTGQAPADGRRRRKPLGAATRRFYTVHARHIERVSPKLWNAPIGAVSSRHCAELYDRIDAALGLAVSAACMKTLSAAFRFALERGDLALNPVRALTIEAPAPNMRVGTVEQMQHLVATADAAGRPEIGDAIYLGLFTAQRQADRLELVEDGRREGWLWLKQQKTGAIVAIPQDPRLVARLDAMRERRRPMKVNWPGLIIDERTGRPFGQQWYRQSFARIVAAAAKTMPSLEGFLDKHLRKTSVTWLANAGCSLGEICQITGHSEATVTSIIRHYLGPDPERAEAAIAKLGQWLDRKGARL